MAVNGGSGEPNAQGLLVLAVKALIANPGIWPIPAIMYLIWQNNQLVWALIERLDRLTAALQAIERSIK